ncbi:MAG: SpoIIE family protein phosphatase [Deltaproteobacteria bacterium]|nr:SpoIIE family protein phosphatase [Deltaproteobacteria bacterium]
MRFSLHIFLFFALLVATLAPIAYLGPTEIARWREIQRQDADKELQFAAESLTRAIGQALDESVRGLTATANHIGIYGSLDPAKLQGVLREYCSSFPSCLGVNVSDLAARPFVLEPPGATDVSFFDREYYQEMERTGRTAISGVEVGRITCVPTIHLCAPIWVAAEDGSRTRVASLVGALGLGYLQDLLTRSVAAFGDTQARVLDRRMRVIVDSQPQGQPALADLSGNALYVDVPAGRASLRDGRDERGEIVRAAVARVAEQQIGWIVAVMRPHWRIEEQVGQARATTMVAFLGALALGVVLAFVLSSWLARPISRLERYTRRVAAGEVVPPPSSPRWDAREVTGLVGRVAAMVTQLRSQADALREREEEQVVLARLKRELEIAEHIQTGILPRRIDVPGYEIGALMWPAEVVGGDYYDLLVTKSGLWVGVGDVSGHGLTAGLVMVMLQSALGALAVHAPSARPVEIWGAVNRLLVENIRSRMGGDDHVTLVLMQVEKDGGYAFAGGHEPIIVLRAGVAKCEVISTPGPWMGIKPGLEDNLSEGRGQLGPGDLLVLHSDGIVEAGAAQHKPFGLERLCAAIERLRERPAQAICSEILREARAWAPGKQDDDMTIVVLRREAG